MYSSSTEIEVGGYSIICIAKFIAPVSGLYQVSINVKALGQITGGIYIKKAQYPIGASVDYFLEGGMYKYATIGSRLVTYIDDVNDEVNDNTTPMPTLMLAMTHNSYASSAQSSYIYVNAGEPVVLLGQNSHSASSYKRYITKVQVTYQKR